ncbi:Na+/H+ antiporter subunit C [Paracoccus spongiarum]|uniref:Na+/H+ antiporter subunit C n=1 Tax=Paracoccus spongiarum TaxID=3064387 RepID=A0ABT9JEH1_9RHOB|nr:Na+/H+ antiporter subunit C [Paracoccus sp. 2205BS29-5]MDP5308231.1 Na+/H+ antiporter subunit C [Paracoccus sp. 2205BS29-5]
MELLVASAVGAMTAAGIYLILRLRSFAVVLGMTMLTYAINAFLFASGRLVVHLPPILRDHSGTVPPDTYTDPLPQALVLTAIVISFGMTAVVVMMALGAFIEGGDDHINMPENDRIMPPLKTIDDSPAEDETA